jgi:hypothetical protein
MDPGPGLAACPLGQRRHSSSRAATMKIVACLEKEAMSAPLSVMRAG